MDETCWVRPPTSFLAQEQGAPSSWKDSQKWYRFTVPWLILYINSPLSSHQSVLSWPIYELFNDGKLSALKNRSEQFLLLQQFFIPNSQSASLSPIGLIPASWNGTSHSTPHLSSIWHSPQIQEDRFVPQNFSSFTLLNHSFLCLQLSGNSKVPDRKGMTSNGISGPLQILGMGQLVQEFGKCAYLKQEYMQ